LISCQLKKIYFSVSLTGEPLFPAVQLAFIIAALTVVIWAVTGPLFTFGTALITRKYPTAYGISHYEGYQWYAQLLWPVFKSKVAGSELSKHGPVVTLDDSIVNKPAFQRIANQPLSLPQNLLMCLHEFFSNNGPRICTMQNVFFPVL
jgi:hypothetical protein